jgi:hypothetical protein
LSFAGSSDIWAVFLRQFNLHATSWFDKIGPGRLNSLAGNGFPSCSPWSCLMPLG